MLKGQNSNFGGFDTYQLIGVREMPPMSSPASAPETLALPLLPDKGWHFHKVIPPTQEAVTRIFQSAGEGTGAADRGPPEQTATCDQDAFISMLGKKGARLNQPSLKICLHVLQVFRAINSSRSGTVLAPSETEQAGGRKFHPCYAGSRGNSHVRAQSKSKHLQAAPAPELLRLADPPN